MGIMNFNIYLILSKDLDLKLKVDIFLAEIWSVKKDFLQVQSQKRKLYDLDKGRFKRVKSKHSSNIESKRALPYLNYQLSYFQALI